MNRILLILLLGISAQIRLDKIEVLALSKDKMTTGRRGRPVPQLTCRGKLCNEYTPSTVLCTNMGSDGRDVQWKCEADMPGGYRFGTIDVSCEGYNYPEDPNILAGSCGLTYELEGSGQPHQHHSSYRSPYNDYTSGTASSGSYGSDSGSGFGNLVWWATIAVLVYAVFRIWKGRAGHAGGGGGGGGGGVRPDPWNPPRGAPPPYTEPTGANCAPHSSGFGRAAPSQGPGFWSGILGGGALGYMMGNRNQRASNPSSHAYGHRQADSGLGSRYSSGAPQASYGESESKRGGGDGGVRTAYGGTSRR